MHAHAHTHTPCLMLSLSVCFYFDNSLCIQLQLHSIFFFYIQNTHYLLNKYIFLIWCFFFSCFHLQFRNFKIVYRRYAGLYFCICVDVNDNNLCYLEAIHNFVEVLNEYFHNVCELDLVFNFYKVYTVVDEMFLAGEIRETSQTKVLKQLLTLNSLE